MVLENTSLDRHGQREEMAENITINYKLSIINIMLHFHTLDCPEN